MRYRFDDCSLDTARRELSRGGAAVAVEPQAFDLIAYLIAHRDRVVSKEDLRAAVWEGRVVSESTMNSAINAARTAIGDNGDDQRLIRTFPRKGFRFVATVQDEDSDSAFEPAASEPGKGEASAVAGASAVKGPTSPSRSTRRAVVLTLVAAALALSAGTVAYLVVALAPMDPKSSGQRFDASVVPLVEDETRRFLAGYPNRPDSKALAITGGGMAVADGQPDIDTAKQEALQRCNARTQRQCRLYAVGMDVVWSKDTIPMAAPEDLRFEPLDVPLVPDDIPTLDPSVKEQIARNHMKAANPRAVALTTRGSWRIAAKGSRAEANRMALERCGEYWQRHCLLLAVDGRLTIQIPKTRRAARVFLPSVEPDIAAEQRPRIMQVYRGPEWRALARGKNGWHPVAGASSETAAVEMALKACAGADMDCRLYAIGNFGIADE